MSVSVYLSGNPDHDKVLKAFAEGCNGKLKMVEEYQPSDVAVVFGVFKKMVPVSVHRGKVIAKQKEHGLKTVILETGYINRGDGDEHHYAAGFDGLNGRADFRNKGMPADRRLVELKPWREGQNYWNGTSWAMRPIVVCGQVPWDASVDWTDHEDWLVSVVRAINLNTDRTVVFRPHPKCQIPPIPGSEYSTKPIAEDLKNAWACVTFNSNSAVEAAIQGIPVFAFDEGSMVWPIANKRLDKIETPEMPDREQWLNDLSYAQWTMQEMREGKAWQHLFR